MKGVIIGFAFISLGATIVLSSVIVYTITKEKILLLINKLKGERK